MKWDMIAISVRFTYHTFINKCITIATTSKQFNNYVIKLSTINQIIVSIIYTDVNIIICNGMNDIYGQTQSMNIT